MKTPKLKMGSLKPKLDYSYFYSIHRELEECDTAQSFSEAPRDKWLISNRPGYKPNVTVNIAGLTDKQLQRLQAAKQPMPQVVKKTK